MNLRLVSRAFSLMDTPLIRLFETINIYRTDKSVTMVQQLSQHKRIASFVKTVHVWFPGSKAHDYVLCPRRASKVIQQRNGFQYISVIQPYLGLFPNLRETLICIKSRLTPPPRTSFKRVYKHKVAQTARLIQLQTHGLDPQEEE